MNNTIVALTDANNNPVVPKKNDIICQNKQGKKFFILRGNSILKINGAKHAPYPNEEAFKFFLDQIQILFRLKIYTEINDTVLAKHIIINDLC
jgi:hypothetical protein